MLTLGNWRTFREVEAMSALPPKADICGALTAMSAKCQKRTWTDHSITSSVRASSCGGKSSPSILAVWTLITSSNLVACATGRSPGFAPLRIRPA